MQRFIAGLSASIQTRADVFKARLARTTPRERLLLAVLVLGALIYAPIAIGDWRARQEERYIDALTDRAAARLAAASARRVAAAAADEQALRDMESWGFDASNVAVAQVGMEQRLVEAASEVGLTNVRITTRNEPEAIGPTRWLGAEVQANLMWTPTFDFLDHLSAWPEGFRVTRFQYEMTAARGPTPIGHPLSALGGVVRMGVAFPVNIADQPADPSALGAGS